MRILLQRDSPFRSLVHLVATTETQKGIVASLDPPMTLRTSHLQSPRLAVLGLSSLFFLLVAIPPSLANEFPNSETTGLIDREALEFHDGDIEINSDTVSEWLDDSGRPIIENLEIRGSLLINGVENVLIRNVHVYSTAFWTVRVFNGASVEIVDSEIGHPDYLGQRGIGASGVVARRLDIHHVEDGVKLGTNSDYDWIYCHDLASPNDDPHYDCMQADGGSEGSSITNSYLDPAPDPAFDDNPFGNAALMIKSDLGPISDVTIRGNYLNGGNFTVFVLDGGHGEPQDVEIIQNAFGPEHRYGFLSLGETKLGAFAGNYWAETGEVFNVEGHTLEGTTSTTSTSSSPTTTDSTTTSSVSGSPTDSDQSDFEATNPSLTNEGTSANGTDEVGGEPTVEAEGGPTESGENGVSQEPVLIVATVVGGILVFGFARWAMRSRR